MSPSAAEQAMRGTVGGLLTSRLSGRSSPRRRRSQRALAQLWALRALVAVAFLAIWQLASGHVVDADVVSRPTNIAGRLVDWFKDGTVWTNLAATIRAGFVGYAIGTTIGAGLGVILGRQLFLARVLDPFITAVYALPKVALAPLFVIWFGIGIASKTMLTVLMVFFLVFYSTYSGVRQTDRHLLEVVSIMGASRLQRATKVILPGALPWILAGMRLAAPYSVVGAVIGEIIVSDRGIGFLIQRSSATFDPAGAFAALALLLATVSIVDLVLARVESALLRWKREGRSRAISGGT